MCIVNSVHTFIYTHTHTFKYVEIRYRGIKGYITRNISKENAKRIKYTEISEPNIKTTQGTSYRLKFCR